MAGRPKLDDGAWRAVVPVRPNLARRKSITLYPIIARDAEFAKIAAIMAVRYIGLRPRANAIEVTQVDPEVR